MDKKHSFTKDDYDKIKNINYNHISLHSVLENVDPNNHVKLNSIIGNNRVIVDVSESEDEINDIALVLSLLFRKASFCEFENIRINEKEEVVLTKASAPKKKKVNRDYLEHTQYFSDIQNHGLFYAPVIQDNMIDNLIKSIPNIQFFSPKQSYGSSRVNGPFNLPELNEENRDFSFSVNTKLPYKKCYYVGNSTFVGYGKCLTHVFKTSLGYQSLYTLAFENIDMVKKIIESSILSHRTSDIIVAIKNDITYKSSSKYLTNNVAGPFLKQVYFPVSKEEDNMMVILNHGGFRKTFSDYILLKREAFIYGENNSIWDNIFEDNSEEKEDEKEESGKEKISLSFISIPTRNMNMGGANAQNISESMSAYKGNLRMLNSFPPVISQKRNELHPKEIKKVIETKNIFSAIFNKTYYIDTKNKNKDFNPYLLFTKSNVSDNSGNRRKKDIIAKIICLRMLSPIEKILDHREFLYDNMESFSLEQKKLIFPDVYKNSISSEEYRILTDDAVKVLLSKLKVVINNEERIFDDSIIKIIYKQMNELIRKL